MIRLEDRQQAIAFIFTLWNCFALYGFPRGEETPVSDTEMVESEFLRLDWCRVCLSLLALTGRPPLSHANEKEPKPRCFLGLTFFLFFFCISTRSLPLCLCPSAGLASKWKVGQARKLQANAKGLSRVAPLLVPLATSENGEKNGIRLREEHLVITFFPSKRNSSTQEMPLDWTGSSFPTASSEMPASPARLALALFEWTTRRGLPDLALPELERSPFLVINLALDLRMV